MIIAESDTNGQKDFQIVKQSVTQRYNELYLANKNKEELIVKLRL
jgi:hypothetical protein